MTTPISELVAGLRDCVEEETGSNLRKEAADLIERVIGDLPQEAIDGCWTARGSSAYAKQLKMRIAGLEQQLQMIKGIRYQEMRLELPEGGHVSLKWPDSMTADSAEMLREVFELQMKANASYMAKRAALSQSTEEKT